MKKVLIISYYWPPAGGGGVMRWLKFVKYLREFGWEPVVYTPEGGEMAATDPSLLKEIPKGVEIVKRPIWEPYSVYKQFIGKKKEAKVYSGFISEEGKMSFTQKLSIWIRGNFFIPDARKYWIKPSIPFLNKYLKDHPVDAMVSTGPPHSMHLIAMGVKKKYPDLPWLADFRDPWTNIDFYDQLMLSKSADAKHRRLEKEVLKLADKVVTVSWSWADDFKAIGNREIQVINNGYDEANFQFGNVTLSDEFSIIHIGSMNKDRNPPGLWKILEEISKETPGFREHLKIVLIGQTDFSILHSIEQHGLSDRLEKIDQLPHADALKRLCESQVLLLPLNNTPNVSGVMPGKLYEYMGAKRPILCIGPTTGDTARVIKETEAGQVLDFGDEAGIKKTILAYYNLYLKKEFHIHSSGITKYSRKGLTKQMAAALEEIVSGKRK